MARRPIALVTAAVLFLEAPGIVAINAVMARFVKIQTMSLDGMHPDAMYAGTWALGIASGIALALCGLVALVAGLRDRRPGRVGRGLLIGCAVVHGVLGAVTVGLIGWDAFAFMMLVLGLIVLTLVVYGKADEKGAGPREGAPVPA
ncbi:hypothetical protein EAO70_29750 [Streptomyces sp. adm13(2018)]|uniref:hypothetical protein n=1 Tax=unclassified Streptomyces TaxID=2593676 RepID=UPI0011CDC995|nr:hypothetical protein [Streptomyces sp. adm13(2018)]TXS11923.1 hypothetical protein EAO70_29750 [Streptomyces sp. adm13(2018)]